VPPLAFFSLSPSLPWPFASPSPSLGSSLPSEGSEPLSPLPVSGLGGLGAGTGAGAGVTVTPVAGGGAGGGAVAVVVVVDVVVVVVAGALCAMAIWAITAVAARTEIASVRTRFTRAPR
jgi:hypothetical protein